MIHPLLLQTNLPLLKLQAQMHLLPQQQLLLNLQMSHPPTLLLEYVILKEVCEKIFKYLNKLVQTISNFVHQRNYQDEWTTLRERVDYVMRELQKLSLEAHNQALNTLKNWFKEVVSIMEEVEVTRNQENNKLYISDTPIYLNA